MRIVTAFAVFVIIPHLLYAQTQNDTYSLNGAFQTGVLYGQAEEIVYSNPGTHPLRTTDDMLSQLLWDMKPVFYIGFTLDYAPVDPFAMWGFFADLNFKIGVPNQKSGTMEDRDWMSTKNNTLTNYSHHDNVTKEFFDIELKVGSSVPFHANWLVAAYAAIAHNRFGFSGMNGYGAYSRTKSDGDYYPIDDNPRKESFSGKVITYRQEWLTISPGITVKGLFFSVFSAEAFFQISPLIFCTGTDTHIIRTLQFKDVLNGGLSMEGGLIFSWDIRQGLSLAIEGSYRHIKGTRGDSYWRNEGDKYYTQEGEAGAGLSFFDSRIFIKVRF